MTRSSIRDFIVGLFVLAGLAAIAYLSFTVGGISYAAAGGSTVYARFDETGGLKERAPVEIAGVKVGRVTSITLDESYRAKVMLQLEPAIELPIDTTASVVTAGILGDRYVMLQPGGEEETLKDGGEIAFTESAVVLERLIGKLVHGGMGEPESEKSSSGAGEAGESEPE